MNAILQRLIDMDQRNRLHHGFLMIGGGEAARENMNETVKAFITYIFTKNSDDPENVKKRMQNHNFPDLFKLQSPEGEIKIENIREMQRWLSIPPLESERKIVWIEDAHNLNLSCSNSLLKTLEEPPSYGLMILQTHSTSHVLPTIRSRLFCVQFPEIQRVNDLEKKEWEDDLETMLSKKTYTDKEIFSFTEQFSDQREELVFLFGHIFRNIRDHMLQANNYSFHKLEKVFDLALTLENELYQNYGNITLGLDRFFLEWRKT